MKFTRDTVDPNAPTVTPATSANSNGWYKSNVTVNITAGTDATSGAYKFKYSNVENIDKILMTSIKVFLI